MNDLRELMDRAAGEPAALTDTELREFARHGRKAVRRRRSAIGAGTVALTAAVATGWALLPAGPLAGPDPATPQTSPSVRTPSIPVGAGRITMPPSPKVPVPLVPDGIRRRNSNDSTLSSLVCGLKPKGWTITAQRIGAVGAPKPDGPDLLTMRDPKHPRDAHEFSDITVSVTEFATGTDGTKLMPKSLGGWNDYPHYQAGPYQAVINSGSEGREPMSADGQRQMYLRLGANTLLQVSTVAPRLGWDLRTALRFAGSCRIVR